VSHVPLQRCGQRLSPHKVRVLIQPFQVRCSKDKPVCTRCTERDFPCVYLFTRRSGRPPNKTSNGGRTASRNNDSSRNNNSSRNSDSVHIPAFQASTGPESLLEESTFPTFSPIDPVSAHVSPGPETNPSSSLSLESVSEWSSRELDDFFATSISVPGLDKLSPFPDGLDGMSYSDLTSNPPGSSPHHSISDCNCLATALGLLGKSECSDFGSVKQSFSLTESLILVNESVAVSVDNILQCRYSQDSQVLIILALVASKVLDRYLRAARASPAVQGVIPQNPHSSSAFAQKQYSQSGMAKAYVYGEDSVRTAGQLVLGEMHRALKLVHGLAARLNERGSGYSTPDWMRGTSPAGLSQKSFDEASMICFSSTVLDQLGRDLRGQLKSVVANITGMLQGAT